MFTAILPLFSCALIIGTSRPFSPLTTRMNAKNTIQGGGTIRTWSCRCQNVKRVFVDVHTEGRTLDADLELWTGPNNTPNKMRIYAENGKIMPFRTLIATPHTQNAIAIRNIGHPECPIVANVRVSNASVAMVANSSCSNLIQGGALRVFPFGASVDLVNVRCWTDGRPLNARLEIVQGANHNKQVVEVYAEDGDIRPFFCSLLTPGSGHVVRVVNTGPIEYPLFVSLEPRTTPCSRRVCSKK